VDIEKKLHVGITVFALFTGHDPKFNQIKRKLTKKSKVKLKAIRLVLGVSVWNVSLLA